MSAWPACPAVIAALKGSSVTGGAPSLGCLASVASQHASRILLACGLLGAALIVLALGLWYYRRRWMSGAEASSTPWTFEDLRAMRDRGDVTEAEYQSLRTRLIGLATGAPEAESPRSITPPVTDPSGETVWSFDLKKTPPG